LLYLKNYEVFLNVINHSHEKSNINIQMKKKSVKQTYPIYCFYNTTLQKKSKTIKKVNKK
jgi:hypothetical protein